MTDEISRCELGDTKVNFRAGTHIQTQVYEIGVVVVSPRKLSTLSHAHSDSVKWPPYVMQSAL